MIKLTNASVSHCRSASSRSMEEEDSGVRDKVSAMIKSFPGVCEIENLYLINCKQNLWIHKGRLSKFFEPKAGTRGLWSVSN